MEKKQRKRIAKSESELLERFPDGVPPYFRMGELQKLMEYKDFSGVRNFCQRHEIPYYDGYTACREVGEKTCESIVIEKDLKRVLSGPKGSHLFKKCIELQTKYHTILVTRHWDTYCEILNDREEKDEPDFSSFRLQLTEEAYWLERLFNRRLQTCLEGLTGGKIQVLEDIPTDVSSLKDEVKDWEVLRDLREDCRKVDFGALEELCMKIDGILSSEGG